MTLVEFLGLLKKRLGLVIALPIIFALAVALFAWLVMPNIYTSTLSLYVLANTADSEEMSISYSDFTVSQMVTNDVAELVTSSKVKNDTAAALQLSTLDDYSISVSSKTNTRVITIAVSGESAQMVPIVANELARTTDNVARQVMNLKSVNAIGEATQPVNPSGPPRLAYTLLGFLVGLFLAIFIAVFMDLVSTKVRNADEVEELLQVPVIGRFPIVER